jgi:acetolactate synthase-1/2/3 large subunit
MSKKTGSQIVCESLLAEGVEIFFGYPGGTVLPLYDTLPQYPKLKHILTRHEQGAAMMADGYARATGKVGVCLATSGPGATNLVTGIANAYLDSVPMVIITGQVSTHLLGTDAFQEIDTTGITQPITKHNYLVTEIEDLATTIKEAFHIARTGRPGPVLIDIPVDIFKDLSEYTYPENVDLPGFKPSFFGNQKQVKEVLNYLKNKKRPVIIAGHGVHIAHAYQELAEFVKKTNIPVVNTLLGLSNFVDNEKMYCGMLGMHGTAPANFAVHHSDLVIAIGIRFDDRITGKLEEFSKDTQFIQIDIDPAEIGKNVKINLPIVGDIKNVLQELNKIIEQKFEYPEWLEQIQKWKKDFPMEKFAQQQIEQYKKLYCEKCDQGKDQKQPCYRKLFAPQVIKLLSDQTKGEAIIATDVGQNQMWTAQYFKFKKPNSLISSGGLGTMGFGLPSAIGAKVALPDQEVWAIVGDGGFQMNIQELGTIMAYGIDVKIAVLNNSYLGMVRQWQDMFYDKNFVDVYMQNPDFVKLAQSYNIKAVRVKTEKEAESAIKKARKAKGPFLIEFMINPVKNIFPMVPVGTALKDQLLC